MFANAMMSVLVSEKRDLAATRRFFTRALEHGPRPAEVTTDRAPAYPRMPPSADPQLGIKLLERARTELRQPRQRSVADRGLEEVFVRA